MTVGRVVLDTNVLISAVLFGGKPRDVFRLAIQGRIDAFTSPAGSCQIQRYQDRYTRSISSELQISLSEFYKTTLNNGIHVAAES